MKTRRVKVLDLLRELHDLGCTLKRHGVHQVWITPGGRRLTIPTKARGDTVSARVLFHVRHVLASEGMPFKAFA